MERFTQCDEVERLYLREAGHYVRVRQFVATVRMAEILRVVRDEGIASSGIHCGYLIGVKLDQDRVVNTVSLPVERCPLVDRPACRTKLHGVGNLDNRRLRKKLLDALDRTNGRAAEGRYAVIDIVQLAQHLILLLGIAEFFDSLLYALYGTRKAAAALLDDAGLITRELVNDG